MTEEDIPEVVKYEQELFTDSWPEAVFLEDIASLYSYPHVLHVDSELAGYVVLWVAADEGHLTNIAVAKKYQRKSIAKKLLSFILRLANEMKLAQINLEVRPTNTPAISLYEKFGFEKLAVHKNYYSNPLEDCLVMRKDTTGHIPA